MESIGYGLLIGIALGAGLSFLLVSFFYRKMRRAKVEEVNQKADATIKEAKIAAQRILEESKTKIRDAEEKSRRRNDQIKQKRIQEAKDKYNSLRINYENYKADQKVELKEREVEVVGKEKELQLSIEKFNSQKESFEQSKAEVSTIKENLNKQLNIISRRKKDLESANEKIIKELENISKLSESEAKEQLLEAVKAKASTDALAIEKKAVSEAKIGAKKEARKIIIQTIQRMVAEFTIENTVSVFNLESDDIKGQIIGREGRNIRALEAATGAEIVVDDTPEAIVISSYDPIRREICRLSLKRLVSDGRIHPARIEEVVAKVKKELEERMIEIGERAIIDLDIHGLDAYLVKMVGRMRFRSSYGQNLLQHSIETAKLCGLMAIELGFNPRQVKYAKRAGLLHDIGKVAEEETELSHAIYGMKMCEKYNESAIVANAVGSHHDEVEMSSVVSPIVQACDAISGARPGARREILESYLKRIGELEDLAMTHEGVQKAYALQAGRELRVIVESDKVSDDYADDLSFVISKKIQDEMQYPGQVKVTVIREKRAVSYAR